MYASTHWINDYLEPPATSDEQADLLTRAGFPLEGRVEVKLGGGRSDTQQDFEMTSNRGDCVCHVGLAREIAAISGRTLEIPMTTGDAPGPAAESLVTVTNDEPDLCPLYTARVIRGITVGPSPDWLADRLRSIGQIPRNNVVDLTNFILFELGQPTHVFDLPKLEGSAIVIRKARPQEPFLPIGEGESEVELSADDLVIADEGRAVAIAGVKGGAVTAVSEGTTDILIEAATFAPVTVRSSSRRHNIISDSSYRFERGVHPGQIEHAADRLAALIVELAGGELCTGVVSAGKAIPPRREVSMRRKRCWRILGVPVEDGRLLGGLDRLGFEPRVEGDLVPCRVPIHRLDIGREIDLIEEVGRMQGLDMLPIEETLAVRVAPPQPEELARRAMSNTLVGMGFLETVTHSLVSEQAAAPFYGPGESPLRVDDERARSEPILRPSLIASLLRVCRHNLDHGARDVRLFESARTFRRTGDGHDERAQLSVLIGETSDGDGLRELRGVVERLVQLLAGPNVTVTVEPEEGVAWLAPAARVMIDGEPFGRIGVLHPDVAAAFDLDVLPHVGELDLPRLYDGYPPEVAVHALPSFPAIERDISAIVPESTHWSVIDREIMALDLEHLEGVHFVTAFRGEPIEAEQKSVTFRLTFRSPTETLRHEAVDGQMDAVVARLTEHGAEIRR